MARRHHRYHHSRRGHAARKWVSLAGKVIGGVVVAGPAIGVVGAHMSDGQWQNSPQDFLYAYTGISQGSFNASQAATGIGSIVGGLVLIKIFSYVARRF